MTIVIILSLGWLFYKGVVCAPTAPESMLHKIIILLQPSWAVRYPGKAFPTHNDRLFVFHFIFAHAHTPSLEDRICVRILYYKEDDYNTGFVDTLKGTQLFCGSSSFVKQYVACVSHLCQNHDRTSSFHDVITCVYIWYQLLIGFW